ncbi:hypothetical protein ACQW02_00065 [Humitalea sp. 24SJ18S-53]|uniref:hypothetical protein n=1 Tax=Humitalea sp. 24SJ18S-53 TaxID=3422307 RepID=UPI003D66DBB9
MRKVRSFLAICALIGILASTATGVRAETVRVTTDSPEYCASLSQRLAVAPGGATEPARSLGEEGRRLCDTGHLRTGIARLRRALRAAASATP